MSNLKSALRAARGALLAISAAFGLAASSQASASPAPTSRAEPDVLSERIAAARKRLIGEQPSGEAVERKGREIAQWYNWPNWGNWWNNWRNW